MRGGDDRSGELFSYVDLEARVRRDHPLRAIRAIVNEALSALEREFAALYSPIGRPSIPPEKLLRAMLLAGVLFDPLGAAADGAAGVRPPVPLVRRASASTIAAWDHSVFSKNRDRLLEGDIAAKFLAAVLAQPRVKKLLSTRSLLGRRHADRGLGVDEELQAEGRLRTSRRRRRRAQCRSGLPRPEAVERDACLDHRSRRQALPQGTGQGGEALLHRPWADGEPPRPAGRCLPDAGRRPCRAGGGAAHDRASRRPADRRSRSAPTRPTTQRTSSTSCAR